jgi:hypothetical protein
LRPALSALARPSSFDLARRVVVGVSLTAAGGERLCDFRAGAAPFCTCGNDRSAILLSFINAKYNTQSVGYCPLHKLGFHNLTSMKLAISKPGRSILIEQKGFDKARRQP